MKGSLKHVGIFWQKQKVSKQRDGGRRGLSSVVSRSPFLLRFPNRNGVGYPISRQFSSLGFSTPYLCSLRSYLVGFARKARFNGHDCVFHANVSTFAGHNSSIEAS